MNFLDPVVIGVVVGFVLKAAADWLTRKSAEDREDRLHFRDRRLDAATDLAAAVTRVADAQGRLRHLDHKVASTMEQTGRIKEALAAIDEGKTPDVNRQVTVLNSQASVMLERMEAHIVERASLHEGIRVDAAAAHRAALLVGMLCGEEVRAAATRLVSLMDKEDPTDASGGAEFGGDVQAKDHPITALVWAARAEAHASQTRQRRGVAKKRG